MSDNEESAGEKAEIGHDKAEAAAAQEVYRDRDASEMQKLADTFMATPITRNYVAKPAPGFDVHGLWHCWGSAQRSGYATHAMSLHWLLDHELLVPTQLVPHVSLDVDIEKFPDDRYDTLFEWHKNAVGHPHAMFVSFPPDEAAELGEVGPPLIPYCAFEGTRVSTFCRDLCNGKAFREVWVVSQFVKEAMIAGGVEPERVRVVRPMLSEGPWAGAFAPMALLDRVPGPVTPDSPFTFGAMGTWHERKGFPDLIRAYWSAFRREEPVQLVIRTSAFGGDARKSIREFNEQITEEIAAIAAERGDFGFPESKQQPKLKILTGTSLTDAEVIDWLGTLDCYANASYGEGLGIPHVWAKCQGVPMVSSGYGAVGQLIAEIHEGGAHQDELFAFREEPVDPGMVKLSLMFDRDTCWGVYDVEHLQAALLKSYERGRRHDILGAQLAREAFGLTACLPPVRTGLQEVLEPAALKHWKLEAE